MKKLLIIGICFFVQMTLSATTFYCDPVNGDNANDGSFANPFGSFQSVVDAFMIESEAVNPVPYDPANNVYIVKNSGAPISAGDTVVLLEGLHGSVFLRNYVNAETITIIGAENQRAILEKLEIKGGQNWRFENLEISSEPYGYYLNGILAYFESHSWHGPCSHIEVIDCKVYSAEEPWETAEEWVGQSSDGIYFRGDNMLARGNEVSNIDMGITANGSDIVASNNKVINFSGDGMRILGSRTLFHQNEIKNCYNVDDNHDDGIQSFVFDGIIEDVTISSNLIINREDPNQLLAGSLQGIGCFDGMYQNWKIINNVVYVDHYHGITLLGAIDCKIVNNTVIDPTPDVTPGPIWIRIADHKDGTPSSGCVVKNNVTNSLIVDAEESNNILLSDYNDYNLHFKDYNTVDFRPLENSPLIDAADAAIAPLFDIEGNPRDQGFGPDVGAYEFQIPSSTIDENNIIEIFPNPANGTFFIEGLEGVWSLRIYDNMGNLIRYDKIENQHEVKIENISQTGLLSVVLTNNREQYSLKLVNLR